MNARRLLRPPASALVVPVPEVADLVGEPHGPGMPPHVTLLWPFSRRPGSRHARALAALAAAHPAFDFSLVRVGEFPGVVYLAPDPTAPFVALVEDAMARWPHFPPYAGKYADIVPHLTVRLGPPATAAERERLDARLPVRCRAREVAVMAPTAGGGWRKVSTTPLTTAG